MSILPTHTYETCPLDVDMLFVAGPQPSVRPPASLEYIRKFVAAKKGTLMTTCTGGLWGASAGVVEGRRVTTNRGAPEAANMSHSGVNGPKSAGWWARSQTRRDSRRAAVLSLRQIWRAHSARRNSQKETWSSPCRVWIFRLKGKGKSIMSTWLMRFVERCYCIDQHSIRIGCIATPSVSSRCMPKSCIENTMGTCGSAPRTYHLLFASRCSTSPASHSRSLKPERQQSSPPAFQLAPKLSPAHEHGSGFCGLTRILTSRCC